MQVFLLHCQKAPNKITNKITFLHDDDGTQQKPVLENTIYLLFNHM